MTPFWQSKTVWTVFLGFLFNVLVVTGAIPADANTTVIIDGILTLLAVIFRWQAAGPLTAKKSQ